MKTIKNYLDGDIEVNPLSFFDSIGAIIFQFLIAFVLSLCLEFILNLFLQKDLGDFLASILTSILSLYIFFRYYFKYSCEESKGKSENYMCPITIRTLLMVLLITLSYRLILSVPLTPVLDFLESKSLVLSKLISLVEKKPTHFLLMDAFILGPIFEEFFHRGVILNGLLKKYSVKKSILLSSLIFGVIHLNLPQMLNAFLFGILLGYIYIKTKSLYSCIFAHIIANTSGSAIDYLQSNTSVLFSNIFMLVLGFILLGCFIILYRKNQMIKEDISL